MFGGESMTVEIWERRDVCLMTVSGAVQRVIEMVLEATMVLVDNSTWSRNGDYYPNRLDAQLETVHRIFGSKKQMNAENSVGVMTMGGSSPEVLIPPTEDVGKIAKALRDVRSEGTCDLETSIQVAQLALKHRKNVHQKQRMVIFVASPVEYNNEKMEVLGRLLRKNGIGVDMIGMGNDVDFSKLEMFVQTVNNNDNSHMVDIPVGTDNVPDMVAQSPVLGGHTDMYEFGVDPDADPELALALKLSMEEEQRRIEREKTEAQQD